MATREESIKYLTDSLVTLFPTNGVKVLERSLVGKKNIHVLYTHFKTAAECINGILENDPAYMHFYIVPERDGTWYIDYPITHCCRAMRKDGPITFRKIRAKSEHEAATKLVAWFAKHADSIQNAK